MESHELIRKKIKIVETKMYRDPKQKGSIFYRNVKKTETIFIRI